jgi:hypothetical protein
MFAEELVTTDYLAALVLLSLKHKEKAAKLQEIEVMRHVRQIPSVITKEFSPSPLYQPMSIKTVDASEVELVIPDNRSLNNNEDWKSVKRIENYVRFACAAYGFVFSLSKKNCAWNLFNNCSFCSCLP